MAIERNTFKQLKLLKEFLEENNKETVAGICIGSDEFGIPFSMDEYDEISDIRNLEEIYDFLSKEKFIITSMYRYPEGSGAVRKPHITVFVSMESEFFNQEKITGSDTGLCFRDENGNLLVCSDLKEKLLDDLHTSEHWKRFSCEFENRKLKNIKMGYRTLTYCPFCGGKTAYPEEKEISLMEEIEMRR